jgi:hypothetical protein
MQKNINRTLTIYPIVVYEEQQEARQRQDPDTFKQPRFIGLPRTSLQHLSAAATINIFRVFDWLSGMRPAVTPVQACIAFAAT